MGFKIWVELCKDILFVLIIGFAIFQSYDYLNMSSDIGVIIGILIMLVVILAVILFGERTIKNIKSFFERLNK